MDTSSPSDPTPLPPQEPLPITQPPHKSHRIIWIVLVLVTAALLVSVGFLLGHRQKDTPAATNQTTTLNTSMSQSTSVSTVKGLQLDTHKQYGNKYASGILPVGDGKYSTSSPQKGTVYACTNYARNLSADPGGADRRGPWFTSDTTYDSTKKAHVTGSVAWQSSFSNTIQNDTRTITTNDLPTHTTGMFPIQSSDPAYQYDRNPNSIRGQTLAYALTASPIYHETPNCMDGTVGIMLTGVQLFSAFDAGGRDAGAWEVQDGCSGHPQKDGAYHYHTLSSCIKDVSVHTVIGYALDGFPITGPQVTSSNDVLTTDDLDDCHGIVSQITANGKTITQYHYVMTEDFPYSVSCYRGTPTQPPGKP